MNKLLTTNTGGEPIYLDDIRWNDDAYRAAMTAMLLPFGTDFIIQGCTIGGVGYDVAAGYVMLNSEILRVEAHTRTQDYYVKVVSYDAAGSTVFQDGNTHNVYQKNRAYCTVVSSTLKYDADRLEDIMRNTCLRTGNTYSIARTISNGTPVDITGLDTTAAITGTITGTYAGAAVCNYYISSKRNIIYFDITMTSTYGVTLNIYDASSSLIFSIVNVPNPNRLRFFAINTGDSGWFFVYTSDEISSILGTAAYKDTGTGAGNVILGNDIRLSDNREIKTVDGDVIHTKIVEIGNWNMNSTSSVTVAHGVADFTKILSVSVFILNDVSNQFYSLNGTMTNGELMGAISYTSSLIVLYRTISGYFDSSLFGTGISQRGYIVMQYTS